MKKLTSLLLSLVLMVSVLACGASAKTSTKVRIAGLKGPTTMGLVNLLSMEKDGTASLDYDLQLYGAADEIVPKLIKGELDMAAIPANLAATLYQKTNGGIQVMAVNTLGVLYVVEKGDTVHSFADLKGRTILSTGKGTTPEYVLRYLLRKNGLDPDKDVKIEYYSEASEVTAQMAAARKDAIAVLPQPYVTAAQMKDSGLRVVLDLTREWNKVCDNQLITGVTVVRTEYAKKNPDVIAAFLTDYQKSVKAANEDIDGTAALCEKVGVVAKAAIAKKALPKCNIVYRNGQEMKKDISAYLQVLYDASPAAVGGKLPDDNFYYTEPSVLRKVMAAIRNSETRKTAAQPCGSFSYIRRPAPMPMRAGSSQPKPRLLRGRAFIKVERGPKGRAAGMLWMAVKRILSRQTDVRWNRPGRNSTTMRMMAMG